MYRILGQSGEVRERREQLRHPTYRKPELLAERPNEVWSWDITKLMGPTKWSYFYLYVILDIFSRRVVGWCVADAESATLFKPLFDDAIAKHDVPPGQLTLHWMVSRCARESPSCRSWRALLTARRMVLNKRRDVENGVRALLREAGLKVGTPSRKDFRGTGARAGRWRRRAHRTGRVTVVGHQDHDREVGRLTKRVLDEVRVEPTCRRLMTVPGVGPLTALAFRATIDRPDRFRRSRDVGAHLGLTPRRYQSGETDVQGRISRCGDELARTALYEAAHSLLIRSTKWSALRAWGMNVAKRRGMARARVAVARKLAVILHRMWVDGSPSSAGASRPQRGRMTKGVPVSA